MRVNIKRRASNESDQRDATLASQIDGEAGWRRNGCHDADARDQGFLNDLERGSAAHEEQMLRERKAFLDQHAADDLVHGIVPSDVFRHRGETAVEAEEILSRVEIPTLPEGARGAYIKHAITPEDLAIAGVAVVLVPDGKNPVSASKLRIGLGGVAPVPLRALKAEAALNGTALTDEAIRAAAEIAASEAEPMSDPHASAEYRRKMIKVLMRRALAAAIEGGERNGHGKA